MTPLPDKISEALDQGWTLAWSPATGWCRDQAADGHGLAVTRGTAYEWALHTSSLQGHTQKDLLAIDPEKYMAWCQILGFHPSIQSLRKIPADLTPELAAPWVPAMVLAFSHTSPGLHAWVPDYKRNWSSWLTKAAAVTSPAAILGWGRAAPPWLVAYVEGVGPPRARSTRLREEALWQYTELTMRWPDMPEPVAAVTATHLSTYCEATAGDSQRKRAAQRVVETVHSADLITHWRDAVRAAFGFSILVCPARGVVRDHFGAFAGTGIDHAPLPRTLPA